MPDYDANDGFARLPGAAPGGRLDAAAATLAIARHLDVMLVVLAVVPALALGVPALGFLVAAGAWVLQRVLAQLDRRWIHSAAEPRTQLGLNLFEAFGRIWLLAGAIIVAGVAGGRADGLTAAVTICAAYSVAFAIRVLSGPPKPPSRSSRHAHADGHAGVRVGGPPSHGGAR